MKRWTGAFWQATTVLAAIYAYVIYRTVTESGDLPAAEITIIAALVGLASWALWKTKLVGAQLGASMAALEREDSLSLPGGRPTWFDLCISRLLSNAAADSNGTTWRNAQLPEVDLFTGTARHDAEQASLWLRWLAQGAVLIGLIGTLFGLIAAIGDAASALAVPANGGPGAGGPDLNERLHATLADMNFCFVSSILGVATSFALGYMRGVHESVLDAHFCEIENRLAGAIPQAYAGWRDPRDRLAESAASLETIGETMRDLAKQTKESTEGILNGAMEYFDTKLDARFVEMRESVKEGIGAGASLAINEFASRSATLTQGANEKFGSLVVQISSAASELGKYTLAVSAANASAETARIKFEDDWIQERKRLVADQTVSIDNSRSAIVTTLDAISKRAEDMARTVGERLNDATKQLTAQHIANTNSLLGSTKQFLDDASKSLEGGMTRFTKSVQDTHGTHLGSIEKATNAATSSAANLAGVVTSLNEQLQASLSQAVRAATSNYVQQTSDLLDKSEQSLRGANRDLVAAMSGVKTVAEESAGKQITLVESCNTALEAAAGRLEDLRRGLTEESNSLAKARAETLAALAKGGEHFANASRDLAAVAGASAESAKASADVASAITTATGSLRDVNRQLIELAEVSRAEQEATVRALAAVEIALKEGAVA